MKRRTFDALLTMTGGLLTLVLILAGVGLLIGANFTSSQVHSQLAEQKVYFPKKNVGDWPDLVAAHETQFAGKEVLTGQEAQIFANDIIKRDTNLISGGKTYAQLSAASQADPSNTALASQVELVFRGDTLQGLLLNAYAFGFIGQIALFASIGAFIAAFILLILTLLGLRHYRTVDPEVEVLT